MLPYLGFFLVLCLAGVGVPIPEEASIVAAGVLAHEGVVRWWLALASCIAGVLVGDTLIFLAGRRWGERVMQMPGVRQLVSMGSRDRLAASYCRHGMWYVFAARHVPGLRAAAFVTAGIARVPLAKFLAADGAAVALGVPFTFTLAYLFTEQVHRLLAGVHRVELWAAAATISAAVLFIVLSSSSHLALTRLSLMKRLSMKTLLSWIRRFLFPGVTVVVGAVMLAVPWAVPFGRAPGGMAVFMMAGFVELLLGVALAYIVLHDPE